MPTPVLVYVEVYPSIPLMQLKPQITKNAASYATQSSRWAETP
jgi:hypothetical protein